MLSFILPSSVFDQVQNDWLVNYKPWGMLHVSELQLDCCMDPYREMTQGTRRMEVWTKKAMTFIKVQ